MADKAPADSEVKPEASENKEAAAPAKGMKSVLLTSAVMAVVMGAVGFGLVYFILPSRLAAQLQASSPQTNPSAPIQKDHLERSAAEVASEGGKQVTKFTIEEVTVNIADTRGNRFVRTGVFFDAAQPVLEELEANRARIVDTLGQVLSTKTLEDLTSPNIRGTLRQELLGILNPTLKQGRIDNIYFTDLLVQ